jgi:hypothetical protein
MMNQLKVSTKGVERFKRGCECRGVKLELPEILEKNSGPHLMPKI